MTSTIPVDRDAIERLVQLKVELDSIVESLDLMSDKTFMRSYEKARRQVKNREFVELDDV